MGCKSYEKLFDIKLRKVKQTDSNNGYAVSNTCCDHHKLALYTVYLLAQIKRQTPTGSECTTITFSTSDTLTSTAAAESKEQKNKAHIQSRSDTRLDSFNGVHANSS